MVPVLKPALASVASALFGVGAWVLAQADPIGQGLNVVGGGILVASAIVALRMILRAAAHEREAHTQTETRLARLTEELEAQLETERRRSARLLVAYDRERTLRISIEAAGLADRRNHRDGRELVSPEDYRELHEHLPDVESPDEDLNPT